MAIYHTRVKTFSRAQGHASTAAAAYRAGLLIVDERTGMKHDYRRRGGVVETRCVAPEDAPDWAFDPQALWPAAEASERRKDATVAREFEIALPHELNDDQRSALTAEIARALVGRYRFAVQASIHEPQTADGLNYHAHILATTRRVDGQGISDKTRELDGGPSGRGEVEWIREMVAHTINAHLASANVAARVDHRSLKDQAADALELGDTEAALALVRLPTEHVGKNATALHRRGMDCARTGSNEAIVEANEASWDAAVAQLEGQGRLQQTTPGHSQDQALREREIDLAASTSGLAMPGHGDDIAPEVGQLRLAGHEATRAVLAEAIRIWREGFIANVDSSFKATSQLLQNGAERVSAFVHSPKFRADLRELLKLFKQLKHEALRFKRRLAAEDRTQHLLHQAEFALERFDSDHPRPSLWSRQEWSARRARRLRAVQTRRDAHRRARQATAPEAQRDYNAQAVAAAQDLETWSQAMLTHYPVPSDAVMAPKPSEQLNPQSDEATKPAASRPRLQ